MSPTARTAFVRKRTLANRSKWPPDLIEQFQHLLQGSRTIDQLTEAFEVVRSHPHGHVASRAWDLAAAKAAHSHPKSEVTAIGIWSRRWWLLE